MSKIIKITPEYFAEICKDFADTLQNTKAIDGKINFTKSFKKIDRKAVLYFTEQAWLKMQTLISEFDKEVAWHGAAFRGEDPSKDEYIITDILVYPQEVTGATVNTNQAEYEQWLMSQEDNIFNNIRMQGHSHVNMGTTPSGVDLEHQEKLLEQLEDDMFYIFVIWNKKNDKTIKIYDFQKNVLFETEDVTVQIQDNMGLSSFLDEAKKLVQDKKPAVQIPVTSGKSTVYSNYYGTYPSSTYSSSVSTDKKRKGKRRGSADATGSYVQASMMWDDDDDYDDDLTKWYTK